MAEGLAGSTVLLAWEMGGGLSHVQTLRRLGKILAQRGARPVLALKNVQGARTLLDGEGLDVLPAPRFDPMPWTRPEPFLATSFSDVLAWTGWAWPERLRARVGAWDKLLDYLRPKLVVCEYAPGLTLAAAGRYPVIEVGSGFTLPPVTGPTFPRLLDGPSQVPSEEVVLAAVLQVQRERGRPEPATLPAAFAGSERFLTVLPEMDPYRPVRPTGHLGPLEELPPPSPPPATPSFFAYLNGEAHAVDFAVAGLAAIGVPGAVYLRNFPHERRERLRAKGVVIEDRPVPLPEALARAQVIVHHGGVKTSQMALAAGRPQVVFPEHLEQTINACLLDRLGVVVCPRGKVGPAEAGAALRRALEDLALGERARRLASDIQTRGPWGSLGALVSRCCILLGEK